MSTKITWEASINAHLSRARLQRKDHKDASISQQIKMSEIINTLLNWVVRPYLGDIGLVLFLKFCRLRLRLGP